VSSKGITFHVLLFQDKLYNSDVLNGVIRNIMSALSRQYQFMDSICRKWEELYALAGKFVLCF